MEIIITPGGRPFDDKAASYLAQHIIAKPDIVLGLSTGETTRSVFARLSDMHWAMAVDFSRVRTFNLDEYVGLAAEDAKSCTCRIRDQLLSRVNIFKENAHIPNGMAASAQEECEAYLAKINAVGGIDLMVLGIGENGHIGFNEPGAPFGEDMWVVPLSEETRQSKAAFFGGLANVPTAGITMGIRPIMRAKHIILMARGASKADIIKKALYGPITNQIPASVLQLHPALTVMLDEGAAAEI